MSRAPSNFRQEDVKRAIKAARSAGLDIARVVVDPKTAKIELVVKKDGTETEKEINPFDNAPGIDPTPRRRRKNKPTWSTS